LEMESPVAARVPPAATAVVEIVPDVRASVEPLSVKRPVFPAVPSLVNESEFSVIVPIVLVPVVWVVPPKTSAHEPDVVGMTVQFEAFDQLPLPPPPVQVAVVWACTGEAIAVATMAATKKPSSRRAD